MTIDQVIKDLEFNKDFDNWYNCNRPIIKKQRLYEEIKVKHNKTDDEMAKYHIEKMRGIQLRYWPDVFKRYK